MKRIIYDLWIDMDLRNLRSYSVITSFDSPSDMSTEMSADHQDTDLPWSYKVGAALHNIQPIQPGSHDGQDFDGM